jgi:osmotically-inducible protein OsmY
MQPEMRRAVPSFLAALVLTVAGLSACALPRPGIQGLDNASAEMAIKSRMLRGDGNFSGVDVVVVDGVALLMGHVPSEADKDEAGRIAWSAPNVRDVGNELIVNPEGRTLLGAHDQVLLSQVRARLLADGNIQSTRVHVEVYDGVVYLLGRVRSAREAQAAAEHASVVPGVARVVSFLGPNMPAVGVPSDTAPYDPFGASPPRDVEDQLLGAPQG